jgi:hypothetical protein
MITCSFLNEQKEKEELKQLKYHQQESKGCSGVLYSDENLNYSYAY